MTVRASGSLARFAVEENRLTGSIVKPKLFEPIAIHYRKRSIVRYSRILK